MVTLQQQARALGDPTRHGIFRYLADADGPVGVAELTAHLGLNHNAIRQHLAKLLDAELVTESRVASGRPGRPRLMYTVDPNAESRWGVTGPYERLSILLTEVIRGGESPAEVGRRAGARYRSGAANDAEAVIAEIDLAMAREGFEPDIRRDGDRVEIVLQNCPFARTAEVDPHTICSLHRGIAEGVAGPEGAVVVDELVAYDPHQAGCRLCLRVAPTV